MTKAERWRIYGLIGRIVRGRAFCKSILHDPHLHPEARTHIEAAISHLQAASIHQVAHTKELLK